MAAYTDDMDADTREEFEEAFIEVAKRPDAVINSKKLMELLHNFGQILSPTEIADMCGNAGVNPEAIDIRSFCSLMSRKVKTNDTEDDVVEAFSVFDKDGNGYIQNMELRSVLTNMGEKLSEAEVTEMLKGADVPDGQINYVTFTSAMITKG